MPSSSPWAIITAVVFIVVLLLGFAYYAVYVRSYTKRGRVKPNVIRVKFSNHVALSPIDRKDLPDGTLAFIEKWYGDETLTGTWLKEE